MISGDDQLNAMRVRALIAGMECHDGQTRSHSGRTFQLDLLGHFSVGLARRAAGKDRDRVSGCECACMGRYYWVCLHLTSTTTFLIS